jgi:PKD repeat protein
MNACPRQGPRSRARDRSTPSCEPASRRARLGRRVLLAAACAAVLLAALAGNASAVIVHLRDGRALSYQPLRDGGHAAAALRAEPLDAAFSNLDYNGGPVMPANTNYTVYWDPAGAPRYPAGYQAGVNRYLEDLAHDSGGHENVDSVSAQYGDSAGAFAEYDSHFGGQLIDTDPYPANGCARASICITDTQLQAELTAFVKAHGLPMDLEHEYFLLTPPKVESCFEASGEECSAGVPDEEAAAFCAYHGNIAEPGGGELIYANDPFVGGNEGCDDGNHPNGSSDSALEGGLSHEHNESLTDPEPNSGWTDFGGEGGEEGDKCRTFEPESEFGAPLGEERGVKYNQVINGHHYWYQQEWSNQTHRCLQRLWSAGNPPTATFTAKALPGGQVSLDASASTAPGGVYRYNWQFNEELPGLTPSTPTETSAPGLIHAFPIPCRYTVALTVFAKSGASTGTAQTIEVGEPPKPSAEVLLATPAPAAGRPVSFAGVAESPDGAGIASYTWSFGDGSESVAGEDPEHTYAAPGTYNVTLTASDVCGESTTVHQSVSVAPPRPGTPNQAAAQATGAGAGAGSGGGSSLGTPALSPAEPLPTGAITLPRAISVGSDGRGEVALRCTGTAPACGGELLVAVRRASGVGRHRRTRAVTIAALRFTIPSGRASELDLRLSALGRVLLRAAGGRLAASLELRRSLPAPALTAAAAARVLLEHPAR